MSVKIKDIKTKVIKEDEGSYSIACSALGVYSTGKNLQDAKKNYLKALELHLSVLREKATESIQLALEYLKDKAKSENKKIIKKDFCINESRKHRLDL